MQVVAEKVTFLGAAKREEQDERRASTGRPRSDNHQQNSVDSDIPF